MLATRLYLLRSKAMPVICCKCGCHLLSGADYTMDEKVWNRVPYNCEKVQKPEKIIVLTPSKY